MASRLALRWPSDRQPSQNDASNTAAGGYHHWIQDNVAGLVLVFVLHAVVQRAAGAHRVGAPQQVVDCVFVHGCFPLWLGYVRGVCGVGLQAGSALAGLRVNSICVPSSLGMLS